MTMFRVVGGTDVGDEEAADIWDDDVEGVGRLLRQAASQGLTRVAIIGAQVDGTLYVASTGRSAEETIGYFQRGMAYLDRWSIEMAQQVEEDDGA